MKQLVHFIWDEQGLYKPWGVGRVFKSKYTLAGAQGTENASSTQRGIPGACQTGSYQEKGSWTCIFQQGLCDIPQVEDVRVGLSR